MDTLIVVGLSILVFILLSIFLPMFIKDVLGGLAAIIAILFDKERRDQFLGFTDNDKEDKK